VAYYSPEARARLAEYGSIGGHIGWANTADPVARLAKAHANSPTEIGWHARKLGLDPDNLTPTERKRAEHARIAYFKQLSMKARDAKRAKGGQST
jgi:hypothetical protein